MLHNAALNAYLKKKGNSIKIVSAAEMLKELIFKT